MMINPIEFIQRTATLLTDQIYTMPIVILMPHSACNCRCVMCDIWKANRNKQEISSDALAGHLEAFKKLNVQWVVLSGGEALMHSNLWRLCSMLKDINIKITILSTGILLGKYANEVVKWSDEVTVSLDGSQAVHDRIRAIPNAYLKLEAGVKALRELDPNFRITARCVLQRLNFMDFPNIIEAAISLELNEISFLAADVSSTAFNRPDGWDGTRVAEVALSPSEVSSFREIIEETIKRYPESFKRGLVAETPEKIRRLATYYSALNGTSPFPTVRCNAPWVSTVIEADGSVRPCFFHRSLGNIHEKSILEILNSTEAQNFRRALDVTRDPICRKCVCSLKLPPYTSVNSESDL